MANAPAMPNRMPSPASPAPSLTTSEKTFLRLAPKAMATTHREQPEVADHADDHYPLILLVPEQLEPLADHVVAIRPEALGEDAVHDRHAGSSLAFGVRKVAAGDQRHVQRFQQMRRDGVP